MIERLGVLLSRLRPVPLTLFIGVMTALGIYALNQRADLFEDTLLQRTELKILDSKFLLRGRVDVEPSVVIAAGDQQAMDTFGLGGAWPRSVYARVIQTLVDAKASAIGFDIVFSEAVHVQGRREMDGLQAAYAKAAPGPALERAVTAIDGAVKRLPRRVQKRGGRVLRATADDLSRTRAELKGVEAALDTASDALTSDTALAEAFEAHSSRVVQGFIAERTYTRNNPNHTPEARALAYGKLADFGAVLEEYGYSWRIQNVDGKEEAFLAPVEGGTAADVFRVPAIEGGYVIPQDAFIEASEYLGFFATSPDSDGVIRRLPLVYRDQGGFLTSLSLMSAALHFGATPLLFADADDQGSLAKVGLVPQGRTRVEVPVDPQGRLLINYYGPSKERIRGDTSAENGVFPRVSLAALYCYQNDADPARCPKALQSAFDPAVVQGKVVLIAMTALGTFDQRVTPFSGMAPGVEIHAAAVQNMIDGTPLHRGDDDVIVEMVLALLFALAAGVAVSRLNIVPGTLVVLLVSLAWWLVDTMVLFESAKWFHQVPLQAELLVCWLLVTIRGYAAEGREKAQLKKEFSTVLSPTVVDELLQNPDLAGLGGDEREMTVMFSDIRGFTSISEKMSPEELTAFLNAYLTPMTEILIERQGTLDKYMGDAIMAFWGAPVKQDDHAERACLAALDMMDDMARLREGWRRTGQPDMDIGIGLNTGLMRVGFMGSERMRNYTLLGDNVNLGSRLEGINKQYGTNIIISETTMEAAKGAVYGRELDLVRVKGKVKPIKIFELMGRGAPGDKTAHGIERFAAGVAAYRGQRFDDAVLHFHAVLEVKPEDPASLMYLERCAHFQESPPPEGWDGVWVMTTK